jgi:hypothetical protein
MKVKFAEENYTAKITKQFRTVENKLGLPALGCFSNKYTNIPTLVID